MKKPARQTLMYAALAGIVFLMAIQLVPYGNNHGNLAVSKEPDWSSPAIRSLAKRACFDCHSNETVWPWYSRIAPVSWLVQWDVNNGRKALNFSAWENGLREGENPKKIKEELLDGEMPPFQYTLLHAEAKLTREERQQLADGLSATALQAKR